MTRRELIGALMATGLTASGVVASSSAALKRVEKRMPNGEFVRVRMKELQHGDTFRFEGIDGVCVAREQPKLRPDGQWGILADCPKAE